jgi:transcriptional regulator with XRE-family HTH domain
VASAYDRTNQIGTNQIGTNQIGRLDAGRLYQGRPDPAKALRRVAGDVRLAAVFKQIRAILGLSEAEMARHLGTDLGTVLDFESGIVDALPPWPVTAQLVERYAQLGLVDPAPILSRLIQLQAPPLQPPAFQPAPLAPAPRPAFLAPPGERLPPPSYDYSGAIQVARGQTYEPRDLPVQPTAPAPPRAETTEAAHLGFPSRSKLRTAAAGEPTRPPSSEDASVIEAAARARRRRRIRRTSLAASPLLFLLGLFVMLQTAPRPVYAMTQILPGVLGTTARGLVDVMAMQTATFKDGLRWIDVGDPRLRKGDRLAKR